MPNPEIVTPASGRLLTAAELRQHIKLLETAEDGLLELYLDASTNYLESWLRRAFLQRTYRYYLDGFYDHEKLNPHAKSGEILLPWPPVSMITSVKYDDAEGVEQTVSADDYQLDGVSEPARLKPAENAAWPSTQSGTYNTVRIQYVAGFATAAEVPEEFKQVIRWMVAQWHRTREPTAPVVLNEIPHTVADFVDQLRLPRIAG